MRFESYLVATPEGFGYGDGHASGFSVVLRVSELALSSFRSSELSQPI